MLKVNSTQGIVTISFDGIFIDGAFEGEPLRGSLEIDAITGGMTMVMSRPQSAAGDRLVEKVREVFKGFTRLRQQALEELERIDVSFDC